MAVLVLRDAKQWELAARRDDAAFTDERKPLRKVRPWMAVLMLQAAKQPELAAR